MISSSGEPEGALSPIPGKAQSHGKGFLPRCHAPARGLGHEQYEQLHICQYQVPLFFFKKTHHLCKNFCQCPPRFSTLDGVGVGQGWGLCYPARL